MARSMRLSRDDAEELVASAQTLAKDRNFRLGLTLGAVVTVLIGIFIFQNGDDTDLEYLWLDFNVPLWIGLGASFVAGAIAAPVFAWSWRRHRKHKTERKVAEQQLQDAKKQLDS